jgi:glycerophosphoryl diester phosphodiesterase
LPDLLDILRSAGRPIGLAIELKHPSPYQLKLEDRVLQVLRSEGWDAKTSTLDNINVTFMSFSPDSVKHLLRTVPSEFICQLVDDIDVEELRDELGLGPLTGSAVANVMKAAQLEAERILDDCEVLLAGPGIIYVREHARTDQRWLESGRRFRVLTVDTEMDVALCEVLGLLGMATNTPARVLAQLQSTGHQVQLPS